MEPTNPLHLPSWVQEFLNEENKGLDVLLEYLAFAQCSVTYVPTGSPFPEAIRPQSRDQPPLGLRGGGGGVPGGPLPHHRGDGAKGVPWMGWSRASPTSPCPRPQPWGPRGGGGGCPYQGATSHHVPVGHQVRHGER